MKVDHFEGFTYNPDRGMTRLNLMVEHTIFYNTPTTGMPVHTVDPPLSKQHWQRSTEKVFR